MTILDGKALAQTLRNDLKKEIDLLSGRKPGLAFILIGNDPASKAYVKMKEKGCKEVGIFSEVCELPEGISEEKILREIQRLNQSSYIDGILIQQPLPSHLSTRIIVEAIDPAKDVDGFHPENIGRLLLGEEGGFIACTPLGVMILLKKNNIQLRGMEVLILGRSNIVGKPLAALLMQTGVDATVTVAHSQTENLKELSLRADILVTAIGRPHFVTANMVKPGAIVVDVGINRTEKGLVGDVDFDSVKEVASKITPVPGGSAP